MAFLCPHFLVPLQAQVFWELPKPPSLALAQRAGNPYVQSLRTQST